MRFCQIHFDHLLKLSNEADKHAEWSYCDNGNDNEILFQTTSWVKKKQHSKLFP